MENIETLIENFSFFDSWEDKYQYLIDLGEKLESLPDCYKTEAFKVAGCQSQVWLVANCENGVFRFSADSDAIIVKGLIAILMSVYNKKSVHEIKSIEVQKIFAKLGLEEHLSPSRRNGMLSMVEKIRFYAAQFEKNV